MSKSLSSSAALPIAYAVLRILIIVNWVAGAGILVLLAIVPHRDWIMTELELSPSPEANRVVLGLRLVAVVGLLSVPLYHVILKRLLAIVETVRAGDPFVAANATRLQNVAFAMLALQILSFFVETIAKAISSPEHPFHFDTGFSISGWLAVLLTYLLAQVFAEGTRMRQDLEGTV